MSNGAGTTDRDIVRHLHLAMFALLGLQPSSLHAEPLPPIISPLQVEPDRNGVNLATGKIAPEAIVLSIPAAPRLRFDRVQNAAPYSNGVQIRTVDSGADLTARWSIHTADGVSEAFLCAMDVNEGKICSSVTDSGSAFNLGGTDYWKAGSGEHYFLNTIHLFSVPAPGSLDQRTQKLFYVTRIEYPDGEVLNYTYESATLPNDFLGRTFRRPTRIATSLGYYLTIDYQNDDLTQIGWGTPSEVAIFNATDPNTPLARLTYNSNGTATDLAGRVYQGVSAGSLGVNIEVASFSETLPTESSPAVTAIPAASTPQMIGTFTRDGVPWTYAYTNPTSCLSCTADYKYDAVTVTGPNGYRSVYAIDSVGTVSTGIRNVVTRRTDELNRATNFEYDGSRPTKITAPEGNYVQVTYDDAGNITSKTLGSKPGSGLTNTVEQISVDLAPFTTTSGFVDCKSHVKCWRPDWRRDALGRQTDFLYNSRGQIIEQTEPADAAGVRRKTYIEYEEHDTGATHLGPGNVPVPEIISRKKVVRICGWHPTDSSKTTCGTNAETRTEYEYFAHTYLPSLERQVDLATGQVRETRYSYDSAGRVLTIDGPLVGTEDAKYFRYDVLGRKTWEISEAAANGTRIAKKFTYRDADDKVTNVQVGVVTGPTDTVLALDQQTDFTYDSRRNPIREKTYKGATVYSVTDRSFLDRGLAECTAVRMNPTSLPAASATAACTLGTSGAQGSDRIAKNVYDTAGQLTKVQKGFGTAIQRDYVSYTYTPNGKQEYVTDANGNKAQFKYDGFDRQSCWIFPSKTSVGVVSGDCITSGDYEKYAYDAVGNRTSLRKRDGSMLYFAYDGLSRVISKTSTPAAGGGGGGGGDTCSGVSFSVSNATAVEASPLVFTVTKTGSTSVSCSVNYATADAAAVTPGDYVAKSGTLTFTSSQTSLTVSVTTNSNGLAAEPDETMSLILSAPTSGGTITDNLGLGTILDDGLGGGGGGGDPNCPQSCV